MQVNGARSGISSPLIRVNLYLIILQAGDFSDFWQISDVFLFQIIILKVVGFHLKVTKTQF